MEKALETEVQRRAQHRCEYCLLQDRAEWLQFQIDHIISLKHGGSTVSENLAWSCFPCNSYKGPNIAGIDPVTGKLMPLFHPRRDRWSEHFQWNGPILVGLSPVARATIQVLWMNHPRTVALRAALIEEGDFPPAE